MASKPFLATLLSRNLRGLLAITFRLSTDLIEGDNYDKSKVISLLRQIHLLNEFLLQHLEKCK